MSERSVFDSIRLSHREIRSILADLDVGREFDESNSRRVSRRWSLAGRKILVTMLNHGGSQRHFVSVARNLSSSGLSFLHGGLLHTGSKCLVTLPTIEVSEPTTLTATIVRCRHLQKHLHDVGVCFEHTIDPRRYIDFGDEHVFTLERVNIQELRGTLLVVEDSRMFQKLVATYFTGSGLELEFVAEGMAGLELIDQCPDMVFVDYDLPDIDGLEFMRRARSKGYSGPMVLLTADTKPGLRTDAFESGANEMLIKPCPPGVMHQAAAEYLLAKRLDVMAQSQIFSTATSSQVSRELVLEFIEDLKKKAKRITSELEREESLESVRGMVSEIKASASGFGFEPISMAASDALGLLEATKSVSESKARIQRLVMACRRTAAPLLDDDAGAAEAAPAAA